MTFKEITNQSGLFAPEELSSWGTTLVVAPHPDDESLGCGGVIALLRQRGQAVSVLFVSDGSMSHPNSKRYPPEARRDLREQEALSALEMLEVDAEDVSFLRLPDTRVPVPASENFPEAVALVHEQLAQLRPQTVLVPWRRDPHGDHRATWHLLQAAVGQFKTPVRWLEYPIWVWESTQSDDLPTAADGRWFRVDVSGVLSQKRRAIAAHVSQTTPLIDDDPEGFTLYPKMIRHFTQPYEYFLAP
ncbi:MAG: PIG-L deacetylase family protein [Tunicatimonas sp.]